MRRSWPVFLFLVLGWVPTLTFGGEEGILLLKLPSSWHALPRQNVPEPQSIIYFKNGETPFHYTEIMKQEIFPKGAIGGVASIEKRRVKNLQAEKCRVRLRPRATDGKRATLVYECQKKRKSGMVLTVEGDKKIYVVSNELPKGKLNLVEVKRLSEFLRNNAKICLRSDPTKCVR